MQISKNKWVSINYTLTDDDGVVIDSSIGREPLGYVHGNGYLIPGLENELEGKNVGDKFKTIIKPEDGYGIYNKNLIFDLNKNDFDQSAGLEVGMQFQMMAGEGLIIVRIIKIDGDKITVDGNHELAGKNLNFDVEVVDVRDATEEELNPSCNCGCGGDCGGCGGDCGGCSSDSCSCDS